MATVLISFIGTGFITKDEKSVNTSKGKYLKTPYKFNFENDEKVFESSIFGSALLQYLKTKDQQVERWLVLGTKESIWCDLIDLFGEEKQEEILMSNEKIYSTWEHLYNEAEKYRGNRNYKSEIIQEDLNYWQNVLTEHLKETNLICQIVGTASDTDSQKRLFETLLNYINSGDNLVFDVTHGLRNQPIIASFVLMYLRWLRNINDIDFYYGAIDLGGEVVKLDFCKEILKATEATAIFKETGNFVSIGKCLNVGEEFNSDLEKINFADEMNRTDTRLAKKAISKIRTSESSPLHSSLSDELMKAVKWSEQSSLAQKLKHKSAEAFDHKQFLKSISLLHEAIFVAYGEKYLPKENLRLETYKDRKIAREKLESAIEGKSDEQILKNIGKLRNSIIHGTDANGREEEAKIAREAIVDEIKFRKIFKEGQKLLNRILSNNIS